MDFVQDHLSPSMNITIPADHEDCYNSEEYMTWIIMMDLMRRHCEEMIDNPHVDKNNPLIIHPKSYIIERKDIPSFKKLSISELPFTTKLGIFENAPYNLTYKYDEISNYNFQIILRIIPVDLYNKNIFEVFNNATELLKKDINF
jgi:hypothetical protein